jgi:hypothetical protein
VRYVATENFTDPTDGQPIYAGLTHCAESADVVRMFPHRFKPDGERGGGPLIRGPANGGTATRVKPAVSRSRDTGSTLSVADEETRELPELRSALSPIEITIVASASARMRDDLFWLTRQDAKESGGYLFSKPTRPWQKSLEVLNATYTGVPKADHLHVPALDCERGLGAAPHLFVQYEAIGAALGFAHRPSGGPQLPGVLQRLGLTHRQGGGQCRVGISIRLNSQRRRSLRRSQPRPWPVS